MLDFRADVLLATRRAPGLDLGPLDQDLVRLFDQWFSGGFLFLDEISLDSPYRQIEILKDRDLVHPMTSLEEMGRRLGRDRRCFALYHRLMPKEPIIFIEVALTRGIIRTIHEIIDQPEQDESGGEPDTAMFYSINNTQNGLAGLGLGKTLIFQVVDFLKREQPEIRNFCTLSPLPGFWRRYLKPILEGQMDSCQMQADDLTRLFDKKVKTLLREHYAGIGGDEDDVFAKVLLGVFSDTSWAENNPLVGALNKPLTQLAYQYLAEEKSRTGRPIDPVANFHLGNGAQVSLRNVNFGANWSKMGLERSLSLMVNYIYSAQWLAQFRGSMTWLGRLYPVRPKAGRIARINPDRPTNGEDMLKLDHFAFEVRNMDAALDFYNGKLGLELLSRNLHEEVGEENAFLALDHGTLELIRVIGEPDDLPPARTSQCPHLAFQTDDMDATLRLFEEKNIKVVKGPLEIEGTERWVYAADPDGNIIEFIHWINRG